MGSNVPITCLESYMLPKLANDSSNHSTSRFAYEYCSTMLLLTFGKHTCTMLTKQTSVVIESCQEQHIENAYFIFAFTAW